MEMIFRFLASIFCGTSFTSTVGSSLFCHHKSKGDVCPEGTSCCKGQRSAMMPFFQCFRGAETILLDIVDTVGGRTVRTCSR